MSQQTRKGVPKPIAVLSPNVNKELDAVRATKSHIYHPVEIHPFKKASRRKPTSPPLIDWGPPEKPFIRAATLAEAEAMDVKHETV